MNFSAVILYELHFPYLQNGRLDSNFPTILFHDIMIHAHIRLKPNDEIRAMGSKENTENRKIWKAAMKDQK